MNDFFIDDIRVNGQASTSATPVISGDKLIISWDFVETPAAPSQLDYFLRIGTSSSFWGSQLFVGNIVDTTRIFTGNFYEHEVNNLSRGTTYYGQIKAEDQDGDESIWQIFSFTINKLPTATNFFLTPANPLPFQNVDLNYTFVDEDGHEESGTKIRWFRNNLPINDYDDLCTLPANATNPGDSWSAKIVPYDGIEFGSIVETESVTIQDIDFGFDEVSILPDDANVDDILKVTYQLSDNEYLGSTNGSYEFEWYVNNSLVSNSNKQIIRLSLNAADSVFVVVKFIDNGSVLARGRSDEMTISDVRWHLYDIEISGLFEAINIPDLEPVIEWKTHKTTALANEKPNYLRVMITKTPSFDGAIWDTGSINYVKNTHVVPDGILDRGQNYYLHIGASDLNPVAFSDMITMSVETLGSSWSDNVDNAKGWSMEFKVAVDSTNAPEPGENENVILPNQGVYIHDGSYFCAITLEQDSVTFLSDSTVVYTIPTEIPDLLVSKTFKVSGKGQDVKIWMDNTLIINAKGLFVNTSKLKRIEYGDVDGKYTNSGFWRFFRYSTSGPFGFGENLASENVFHFHEAGKLKNGSIEYILNNLIAWTPDNPSESSKLIQYNENADEIRLPTVTKNFSPITKIFIDKDRNKYIATANGVNAIYGEKKDADFAFITSDTDVVITSDKFDRITSVGADQLSTVEPDVRPGWFTIDTTYRSVGEDDLSDQFATGDPYDPYRFGITSHAIHYYSQRAHGHAWYDQVDNEKGWQISFSFLLDNLEQDDHQGHNLDHKGFGVYVNDGKYQEILYFYEDRIRLFYANVYVPIVNTVPRDIRIVGKDKNILIYQKLSAAPTGSYQLLLNGSGMLTTPATKTGNNRKPKIIYDTKGLYHAVWHDDGNSRSQILYSSYDGASWSHPEIITETTEFNLKNPSIGSDSLGRVWVAYEDTSWGQTEISVSVKDDVGWNPKTRITNHRSNKGVPSITVDFFDNVHIVWEDDRNGSMQILWAKWDDTRQAWLSSGQFGTDEVVMQQHDNNDPYVSGGQCSFHNPQLVSTSDKLWLVAEGHKALSSTTGPDEYGLSGSIDGLVSVIYRGFFDLSTNQWHSIGSVVKNSDGTFLGIGQSSISSPVDRFCVKPTVAADERTGLLAIAWEDQHDPLVQIWSSIYSLSSGNEVAPPTQVTSRIADCNNPSIGFAEDFINILFDSENNIRLSYYDANYQEFFGSNLGGEDRKIQIPVSKLATHPAIAPNNPTKSFRIAYEFLKQKDGSLQSVEFPDYVLIGTSAVLHGEVSPDSIITATTTTSDGMISNVDSKEFAFGDLADNVGMLAHWKDISIYFGYDARPQSVIRFNQDNIPNWPDNRTNDLYVDVFGNIIAATYGGLVYHNVFTGVLTNIDGRTSNFVDSCTPETCLLLNKVITSVQWGKSGVWYIGTNEGAYITTTAGKFWEQLELPDNIVVYDISVDQNGDAYFGTSNGIYIANRSSKTKQNQQGTDVFHIDITSVVTNADPHIRSIAVDDNDIVWAGSESGLLRIENRINFMTFNRNSGMKSNHVTSIAIADKHLRFIGTANGVNRMYGTRFSDIDTKSHELVNNNIASLSWDKETNSLWVAALYQLSEIVFRDPVHDIIDDEIIHYDNKELLTEVIHDTNLYFVLDLEEVQPSVDTPISLNTESAKVFINRNEIEFGFIVDEVGSSILFDTDLLINDQVEVLLTNKFIQFHDFNQTEIEKSVKGDLRTGISKLARTASKGQLLSLSGIDKHKVLLYIGESRLPFASILLDRDAPLGCLEQLDILTRTNIRFKILAYDELSGIDGYILSNYENFTADGTISQSFLPLPDDGIVEHNIGEGINNVFTSLTLPTTATIDEVVYEVGDLSALSTWTDPDNSIQYLLAFTSSPTIVFKHDPVAATWSTLNILDKTNLDRVVVSAKTFNNIVFISTGDPTGSGAVYSMSDGLNFSLVNGSGSVNSQNAIAGHSDGTVYFGDGSGNIYRYRDNVATLEYSGIGEKINDMDIFNNLLVVATGNLGRVYVIDLETGNNLIIFDSSQSDINALRIKDSLISTSPEQTSLYAGISGDSTIYRSDLDSFDFVKSYSSFNKNINHIEEVDSSVLIDREPTEGNETTMLASVGKTLFQHSEPAWEFIYENDEEILDFTQFTSGGIEGVFLLSKSKVIKWTNEITQKTVFLRLKDKAGNITGAPVLDPKCPDGTDNKFCCTFAYSINIADLKSFVNENRIVNVDEYGKISFTYDSPTNRAFYSADEIDEEVGIYTSEIFNGSNNLVSWKNITWASTEPSGTSVNIQIRSGVTESEIENADWSPDLVPDIAGLVSLEHITDQYIQFRAILKSTVRGVSPSLTSVVIRNLTTQASHFFTTNFVLPSRPIKGLLTANTFLPVASDIVFGINTKNTTDFGDYQIIEPNRIFTTSQNQFGQNFRIGAKLLSPGISQIEPSNNPGDPYDESSFICMIDFSFENIDSKAHDYHFRVRFYNDTFRTQLIHTFFSGNDQTGWSISGGAANSFPSNGIGITSGETKSISFDPVSLVEENQKWYITVDAFNGINYETITDNMSYVCASCNLVNELGLVAQYFKTGFEELTNMPNFSSLTPDFTVIESIIDFAPRTNSWITTQGETLDLTNNFAAKFIGRIQAPVSGTYTFALRSDDGAILFIDNTEIINHDGKHTYTSKTGSVFLSEGFHDIEIQYFESFGEAGLQLRWIPPNESNESIVPSNYLFHVVTTEYCDLNDVPTIFNLAVQFELENGENVKVNLT